MFSTRVLLYGYVRDNWFQDIYLFQIRGSNLKMTPPNFWQWEAEEIFIMPAVID